MKSLPVQVMVVGLVVGLFASAAHARKSTTPVTFIGIDYSLCHFIGAGDFSDPTQVTTYYPGVWNTLFIKEKLDDLNKAIGPLAAVVTPVEANNAKVTPAQIIHEDGGDWSSTISTISESDRLALVKGYAIPNHHGLGLVLIMDRLVKMEELGCGWITYFDIDSRTITAEERVCADAGGFGFRNYWFNPIKEMLRTMKKVKP
jgi:hypothetical protein